MPKYNIPITWRSWGIHKDIEADSIEEAMRIAYNLAIPDQEEYVECSAQIDYGSLLEENQDLTDEEIKEVEKYG